MNLNYILETRGAHKVKLIVLGLLITSVIFLILYLVNMIDPFARLTKSAPSSTFVELIFCVFIEICLILKLRDQMYQKPLAQYKCGLEIIIFGIGILSLIDFICWFINPVCDIFAAFICLFTSILSCFSLIIYKLQRQQMNLQNEDKEEDLNQQISQITKQSIPQTSKCSIAFQYIVFSFIFLLVILNTCQIIHEAIHPGSLGEGEIFYTVKSQGKDVSIRTFCLGLKSLPQVILEAGGGSSGIDFYLIQTQLSSNYRVCSYDRAGYGMSWQAPAPQSSQNTMKIAQQVMEKVGFNTSIPNSIVCIGHSVGGQLCRYYALYMQSIQGIILLDSVPVMNWFYIVGQCQNNQTASQTYQQQVSTQQLINVMSSFFPFYIETPFFNHGNDFDPQNLQNWVNWQITTTRNWYSQSLGHQSEIEECSEQCMQQSIVQQNQFIDKPIIAITASNSSISCQDRNFTGTDCQYYLCSMQASIQLTIDQTLLGNEISTYAECQGICDHNFIWKQPDWLVQMIEYYIPLF